MKTKNLFKAIIVGLLTITFSITFSQSYDVVILNGRVMDPETNFDAVRNVGIKDGKITIITEKKIKGSETIDAKGLVVAPGFIDMHNHNAGVPFGEKLAIRDGVTSPLELEAGVYPVDEWYGKLEGKCRSNYGATVGTLSARETTFNPDYKTVFAGDFVYDLLDNPQGAKASSKWSTVVADDHDIHNISNILEEGLKQGALGVGHAVGYMVDGCSQHESVLAQQLAAKYGRSTFLHGRYSSQQPPEGAILGFMEMMAPQATYGGGLVIQHMTAQSLNDTEQALQLIDDARSKGQKVLPEIYPYNYGNSIVSADYLRPDNYQKNMGRNYSDIILTATLEPLTKHTYDSLVKNAPFTNIMFMNATDSIVHMALAHPASVLGSDAFPYVMKADGSPALKWDIPYDQVNGHPRGAGAHARLLRFVREKKVDIPLMLGISKMTYMIADYLEDNGVNQMASKGRIQKDMDADITIFDPETVADKSTMQNGGLPSAGIPYVLVNGVLVVKDSKVVENVFPGKPIRCSVSKN